MNWMTTNIRLPEDLYLELRMDAARSRKSIAAVMRGRLVKKRSKSAGKARLMRDLDKFAKEMARKHPGLSLSRKLIEMRYEQ